MTFIEAAGTTSLTFAELLEVSERVALRLESQGAAARDLVDVKAGSLRWQIIGFWAAVLGGFPVQISSGDEPSRARWLLEDGRETGQSAQESFTTLLDLRGLASGVPVRDRRSAACTPEDVCIVTKTSGSSGQAKLVALSHASVVVRARASIAANGLSERDVQLNWLPLRHIGSLSDWHVRSVLVGCNSVLVATELVTFEPTLLLDLITRFRVTHTWSPNFFFELLSSELSGARDWKLDSLVSWLSAGESVAERDVDTIESQLSPFGLQAGTVKPAFGMAETGSGVTYFSPGGSPRFVSAKDGLRVANVGRAIAGVDLRIVDSADMPRRDGEVGHLQIRGPMVFAGYLETHRGCIGVPQRGDSFVGRWLRTGDLAFIEDGALHICGRSKNVFSVRGRKFGCEALEQELRTSIHVYKGQLIIHVAGEGEARERLVVLLTPRDATSRGQELARADISRRLSRFGIRAEALVMISTDAFLRTAIGKPDRVSIIAQHRSRFTAAMGRPNESFVRAFATANSGRFSNQTSHVLERIWSRLLGFEVNTQVELDALGVDSLMKYRATREAIVTLGLRHITPGELFRFRTLQEMADYLTREGHALETAWR